MSRTTTFIALAQSIVALGLVACGGSEDDPSVGSGASTGLTPDDPVPGGNYVGMSIEEASMLADARKTPWRVGREDDESFALTQDYVVGRVTFEVDEGIVTRALIEGEEASGNGRKGSTLERTARARLYQHEENYSLLRSSDLSKQTTVSVAAPRLSALR